MILSVHDGPWRGPRRFARKVSQEELAFAKQPKASQELSVYVISEFGSQVPEGDCFVTFLSSDVLVKGSGL